MSKKRKKFIIEGSEKEQTEILKNFAEKFSKQEKLDPDILRLVNLNFWKLI